MARNISTDDLILWHYNRKKPPSPYWLLPMPILWAPMFVGACIGVQTPAFYLPLLAVLMPWGFGLLIVVILREIRDGPREWAMLLKKQEVPWRLLQHALVLYPDNGDWVMAAIECNEAHLPGDCPLCGAQ